MPKNVVRLPTAKRRKVKNPGPAISDEGNVVVAGIVGTLDIPPERVLRGASDAKLSDAVVIGWDADGDLYFASSYASGPEVLWLLALAQKKLIEAGD